MGRILKKKTDNQKIKQKNRLKTKGELSSNVESATDITDVPKKIIKPSIIAQKKNISTNRADVDREPNIYEKTKNFLNEVNIERKKVVWPGKNQVVASTVVVIILVIIVSSFLGLYDFGLKSLIRMVLH